MDPRQGLERPDGGQVAGQSRAPEFRIDIAQVVSGNAIDLKVLVKPLVNLIWLAGFVFVGGALIAMWPDAVELRRLAERYEPGAVIA